MILSCDGFRCQLEQPAKSQWRIRWQVKPPRKQRQLKYAFSRELERLDGTLEWLHEHRLPEEHTAVEIFVRCRPSRASDVQGRILSGNLRQYLSREELDLLAAVDDQPQGPARQAYEEWLLLRDDPRYRGGVASLATSQYQMLCAAIEKIDELVGPVRHAMSAANQGLLAWHLDEAARIIGMEVDDGT